jgi:hypothetical protein
VNSIKAAQLFAETAVGAFALVDEGGLSAPEFALLLNGGLEKQVKVGGINVAIDHDLGFR